MATGLEQVLDYQEHLKFSHSELEWHAGSGRLSKGPIDYLAARRFAGVDRAMPEGAAFFPNYLFWLVSGVGIEPTTI